MKKIVTADSSIPSPSTPGSPYTQSPPSVGQPPTIKDALTAVSEVGNGLNSQLETSSGAQTANPENQRVPAIPVRSSSNSKSPSPTVPPETGQAAGAQTEKSKPDLKGNARAGSRSGSVASSKHSKVTGNPSSASNNIANLIDTPSAPANERKPKKRAVSRFLHLLNCCNGPDNATAEPDTQPVPAKPKGLQQTRGRQPPPVVKPTPSAADSSTGESKEAADGNIGGPPYLEHTPASKPKMLNQQTLPTEKTDKTEKTENIEYSEKTETTETTEKTEKAEKTGETQKVIFPDNPGHTADAKEDLADPGTQNQALSPLSATPENTIRHDDQSEQLQSIVPVIASNTEDTESTKVPLPNENAAGKAPALDDDRSPKQEESDSDVLMTDAPPIAPAPDGASRNPDGSRDESQPHINLPPPPPRNGQDRAAGGIGRSPSNAATQNEKQQFLLPPLQPRFRGKKCLVLDLDETLVHSSFKVNFCGRIRFCPELTSSRYFIKPILRYL